MSKKQQNLEKRGGSSVDEVYWIKSVDFSSDKAFQVSRLSAIYHVG